MISKLEIHNFKAIVRSIFDLTALNVFAGVNGVGKSSCLQVLLLLEQSWLQDTLMKEGLSLRGELVDLGCGEDVLHQFVEEDTILFALHTLKGKMEWIFEAETKGAKNVEILKTKSFFNGYSPASSLQCYFPFKGTLRYLSAERVGPKVSYDTSVYSTRKLDQIGSQGQFAIHYLAEHKDRTVDSMLRHESLNVDQADLLSNVRAWMGEISPGLRLDVSNFELLRRAFVGYSYDVGPEIVFSRHLAAPNVGFGISYVLPVVVAALSSSRGDYFVVENPESHLHPSGQVQIGILLARLAESGVQVFVETHSDHLVNGFRLAVKRGLVSPENVVMYGFNRRVGDPLHDTIATKIEIDSNGKLSKWPDGFFDQIEKSLFELM